MPPKMLCVNNTSRKSTQLLVESLQVIAECNKVVGNAGCKFHNRQHGSCTLPLGLLPDASPEKRLAWRDTRNLEEHG